MSRLDELQKNYPIMNFTPIASGIVIAISLFVIWSFFTQLDEVSVAMGEVVPQGKVKVIQHLEGGIILDIHAREGDIVKEGDDLIQLDLGAGGVNKEELQVRLDGLLLNKARLEAEATNTPLTLPDELRLKRPNMAGATERSYHARIKDLETRLDVLRAKLRQRELAVTELEEKIKSTRKNLSLTTRRFKMSENLLKDRLTSQMDHLELESELEELEGTHTALKTAIPTAKAAANEAENQLKEELVAFQKQAREELGKVEQGIAETRETLSKATDQGIRALIKSPINGIVKNLSYNTIGGVVRSGEPIMEIVPTGENLVIEARLRPTDRGYVEQGQAATVKVSTYDFVRYGGLDGTVILVAPDSTTSQEGETYFRVVVQTDKTYLGEQPGLYEITPGMEATVDIHTGKKSVIEYLVKPVLKMRHEAFRER